MSSRALLLVLSLGLAAPVAAATPLGPADRASAETLLQALRADPMADGPFAELQAIYRRGPGLPALYNEFAERAQRKPPQAADLVVLGRLELARGRRVDAVRTLARAVVPGADPALMRAVGRVLDENGGRQDAIRAYQAGRAGASPTELRAICMRLGVLLLAENKVADARALWAEAMRAAPADAALRRQVAEALASRGAYREAVAELKGLEALVAADPPALVALLRREAEFLSRQGDRAGATDALLRAYLAAADLRQSAVRAELTLDLLRAHKGKRSGLTELLQTLHKRDAKSPAAAALEGDVLAASDDKKGAIAAFHRALASRPNDVYVLRRLCALQEGEARLEALTRLFDLDRNDATIGLDLVNALFEAKHDAHAVSRARVLKERFTENPLVLAELTRSLATHGQHAAALTVAEHVLKLDPDRPDAIVAYADELGANQRAPEASRAYFRLVEKDPSLNGYRHLIDILSRRRLNDDLRRAYKDAITRTPDAWALRRDYARLLASTGDVNEAMAQWKAIEAGTRDGFLREFASRELKRLEKEKILNH
jgi:tetratricopeptide (TPR) repeat protein